MQPLMLLREKLDEEQVGNLVRQVLCRILEVCEPVRIILFGSAARGEMSNFSDLDFIVLLEDAAEIKQVSKKVYRKGPLCDGYGVDLVWLTLSEYNRKKDIGGVCEIAEEEAIILYPIRKNE